MRGSVTSDPSVFLAEAGDFLAADPVCSNVLATNLDRALAGRLQRPGHWLLVRDEEGRLVALAGQTPPWNLVVTPVRDPRLDEVAAVLAGSARADGLELPGVTGVRPEALAFARAWCREQGLGYREQVAERMYQLETVQPPPAVPGRSRAATEQDLGLCTEWFLQFHHEAMPDAPVDPDLGPSVLRRIRYERITLWEDADEPVSLAASTLPVAGVSRIGPVYTPPQRRGHGYGSAVTAAASQLCLAAGATRCMLFTDLANPTSNAIYQRIGYRPVADAVIYRFRPEP